MHKHWYRGNYMQRHMMDLPESWRAKLPASEDETVLRKAERAIREQYAAELKGEK